MKKKKHISLILFIILVIVITCRINHSFLKMIIRHNLRHRYGIGFSIQSLTVEGDAANFVCYPDVDPLLMFDGLANSRNGHIVFDRYAGAIIANEDAMLLEDNLKIRFGDAYVHGSPVFEIDSDAWARSVQKSLDINNPDFVQLHNDLIPIDCLFFYVFINTSNNQYVYGPENDYELLEQSVEKLVEKYRLEFDRDICVDMHVYFLDEQLMEYSREYFETNLKADYDFNKIVSPKYEIVIEMGSRNVRVKESLRKTIEEFAEERERIK